MRKPNLFRIGDLVRLGLHGVMVHKVRSMLTILGILFGVWSVIAMLAINAGLSAESQAALRKLGSTNIIINAVKPQNDESASKQARGLVYGMKPADAERLRKNVPGTIAVALMHSSKKKLVVGSNRIPGIVAGVQPNYPEVANLDMFSGRFLTQSDTNHSRAVCVITRDLSRRLFAHEDPLGQEVYFSAAMTQPYTVIGVLVSLPEAMKSQTGDTENCAIIPLATDRQRIGKFVYIRQAGGNTMETVDISQIILKLKDEDDVLRGAPIVRRLMKESNPREDYAISVPVEQIQLMKKDRQRWNFMFFLIASVSLLVGGIGIMNIMLASVTERTREIGVRRALGAKQRDIIIQFIVESITLTTIGGLLGIGIGLAVPWAVEKMLKFTTLMTPATLWVPFVMAVIVGLLSGLYPATRAAKLDPIDALRHE